MAAGGGAIGALLAACVFAVVGAAFGGAIGLIVGPFCGPFATVADFWVVVSLASLVCGLLVGVPCAIAALCHGTAAAWRGDFSVKGVLKATLNSYVSGNAQYATYGTLRRMFRR
jgi:hypothetical protein